MPTELRAAVGVVCKPWHNFVRLVSAANVPKTPNTRHRMKIIKLEDFHADGGWDTYSFLKITTDEGITGWSEFNESRRKGMTSLIHGLGATLIGVDRGRTHVPRHRRHRERLPRHPRQGARCSRLRASRRRGARAHAGLLVALRSPARPL